MILSNKQMRHLWVAKNHLSKTPTGQFDLLDIIKKLGFVQLDTILNVSRAHHHILWSRNQNFRSHMLDDLLAERGKIFEHFTHDASILPVEFYPMWQKQFKRKKTNLSASNYYKSLPKPKERAQMKARIVDEGPLSTHAFDTKITGQKQMWARPPHKIALDYMWYIGELSTSHRHNFHKYYDLTERVIPQQILATKMDEISQINALCEHAFTRLGIATHKQIRDFWEACHIKEVKQWFETNSNNLIEVEWHGANGTLYQAFAHKNMINSLDAIPKPSSRMRILNPFDPMIRDRDRLKNIFGFEYKIEIFVPEKKRKYGYYVYPLFEADKFVGRIELKANRKSKTLNVVNFWEEAGIRWSINRYKKLESELQRFAAFAGLKTVDNLSLFTKNL